MIKVTLYNPETDETRQGGEELIEVWARNSKLMIWADFDSVDKTRERQIFGEYFEISPLALDDAQRTRHPPKLEWFDDYFFLLLKAFSADTNDIDFGILHISFFVGRNFIVTRREGNSPSINQVQELVSGDRSVLKKGPSHIFYRIVRRIIDRKTPIIIEVEKQLEKYEEIMMRKPSDKLLMKLIHYNSRLKKLKRIFRHQEAILAELYRKRTDILDDEDQHEMKDLHEHMERLASLSALLQELIVDLVDGYISISSHRLNNIMKVLTIVAVFFLPLTFIAGVYGMNFEYMPELGYKYAYFIILGVMAVIAVMMFLVFRKIHWL